MAGVTPRQTGDVARVLSPLAQRGRWHGAHSHAEQLPDAASPGMISTNSGSPVLEHGRWSELFENGDQWPINPALPRPASGGFAMLTGVSGAGSGEGAPHMTFVASVASSDVHSLRISSSLDEHDLVFDPRTGIFVALSLQPDHSAAFELLAFDGQGIQLDRVEYSDPWSK